jgi:hypothetical protein
MSSRPFIEHEDVCEVTGVKWLFSGPEERECLIRIKD